MVNRVLHAQIFMGDWLSGAIARSKTKKALKQMAKTERQMKEGKVTVRTIIESPLLR
jgi:hypothetical protein